MAKIDSESTNENRYLLPQQWADIQNTEKLFMIREMEKAGIKPKRTVYHNLDSNGLLIAKAHL